MECAGISMECARISMECAGMSMECAWISMECAGMSVECAGISMKCPNNFIDLFDNPYEMIVSSFFVYVCVTAVFIMISNWFIYETHSNIDRYIMNEFMHKLLGLFYFFPNSSSFTTGWNFHDKMFESLVYLANWCDFSCEVIFFCLQNEKGWCLLYVVMNIHGNLLSWYDFSYQLQIFSKISRVQRVSHVVLLVGTL